MKIGKGNVIVFVKQPVHPEQTRAISASIGTLNGVINAQNSRRAENLICVDYDPQVIGSRHILNCVSEQGFEARLVGM